MPGWIRRRVINCREASANSPTRWCTSTPSSRIRPATTTRRSWTSSPDGRLREREALLGLFVEVGRERPLLRDGDVAGQVGRVGRADDRRRQAGVAESEAQDELHIAHARLGHQAGDAGGLPVPLAEAGVLAQRPGLPVLVLRRGAAGPAA